MILTVQPYPRPSARNARPVQNFGNPIGGGRGMRPPGGSIAQVPTTWEPGQQTRALRAALRAQRKRGAVRANGGAHGTGAGNACAHC